MLGKWVMIDDGEYYQVGVVTFTTDEYAFIRLRPPGEGPVHYRLYELGRLAVTDTMFFDLEKELDDFIAWLEVDPNPQLKVVSLKGKSE